MGRVFSDIVALVLGGLEEERRKVKRCICHSKKKVNEQEVDRKINRAFRHKIRKQEVEEINVCEKLYYKKYKEDKWRGPAKVLGKDRKTVVVKQGSDIREINRSHVMCENGDYFKNEENKGENDEDEESEDEEERGRVVERREVNREEEETEDSETEEEEEVDEGDTEEEEEVDEGDTEEEEETFGKEEFKSDEEKVEDGDESEEERGVVKEKEKQLKGNIIKLRKNMR